MSFAVVVQDALVEAMTPPNMEQNIREGRTPGDLTLEVLTQTLQDDAVRREVYEKASLDPVAGDEIDMLKVHAIADALVEVLCGR